MDFSINYGEFQLLIVRPCYICKKDNASGLDRIDNNLGYSSLNVYPCCFDCNRMKSNKTTTNFIEYLTHLNPNHELLFKFNRLKDTDNYNKKVEHVRNIMQTMGNTPEFYET
jgi:hypothetical protein